METIYPVVEIETGKVVAKLKNAGAKPKIAGQVLIASKHDLKDMTTKALLAMYNELSGSNTKRFSSREAGEGQIMRFLNPANKPVKRSAAAAKPAAKPKAGKPTAPAKKSAPATAKEADKPAPKKVHHRIEVAGKEYKSVREAFAALKLPLSKHIAFRGLLNKSDDGQLSFEWEGKSYLFKHAS